MMKWKVVKNPRCASADRTLDFSKNSAPLTYRSDSNNNEQDKQEPCAKETGKQQDHIFTRKPSLVKSDCINLKSFLGLTRQRSEINLSDLGLLKGDQRRSHSEVRGVSCDRLTVGYHHSPSIGPAPSLTNTKTRSSSPINKSVCWLRGRKREREVRNSPKSNVEIAGKTVVTESGRSHSKSVDFRTIADQTNRTSAKVDRKSSKDNSNGKSTKKNSNVKVVEEDIYAEIGQGSSSTKLSNIKRDVSKGPNKKSRKKGLAPQIPSAVIKELNVDVNLNPNGTDSSVPNCFDEKPKASPCIKPPRKITTVNGAKQRNDNESKNIQIDNLNNITNSKAFHSVKEDSINKVVAVAEIHRNATNINSEDEKNKKKMVVSGNEEKVRKKILSGSDDEKNCIKNINNVNTLNEKRLPKSIRSNTNSDHNISHDREVNDEKERAQEEKIEIPPYHIDTPDYSTLESEIENNVLTQPSKSNPLKISTDSLNTNGSDPDYAALKDFALAENSEKDKSVLDITLPSILRGSTSDIRGSDSEYSPKKIVRFEKFDLIEQYKKNKTDNAKGPDEESDSSSVSSKSASKKMLDVNSNEITGSETENLMKQTLRYLDGEHSDKVTSSSECLSECSLSSPTRKECPHNGMTVNVVVRNPSPDTNCIVDSQTDDTHAQLVVKKSFVLTIAKQERGFKSLWANKRPEAVASEHPKKDHKISVTFLCSSNSSSDTSIKGSSVMNSLRLRSLSVPPQMQPIIEPPALPPPMRGRSRERRSKERAHCKKNHKSRKKEAAFHMPQAVIDELSQVLEKRNPSPKGIPTT